MSSAQLAMLFCIVVPLLGAVVIRLLDKSPNIRETATIVTAVITFLLVISLYPAVQDGETPNLVVLDVIPGYEQTQIENPSGDEAIPVPVESVSGISIELEAEPLGMLFALMASFLWIVTSIYSIGYMRGHHEQNQTRFYVFFAIAISSALGVALAANGFTLFLFYEALTLSTFPLVSHAGDEKARKGARIYLFMLLGTSVSFLLLALIWTWSITKSLDFAVDGIFGDNPDPTVTSILLVLYVFGIGKAALMPFHRWLPTAMVAPTPVSALLHAVAVVKAGVFSILKIVIYLFGIDLVAQLPVHQILAYVAAYTIIATALIAMRKDNLKARLAYSTVSQLSYIVLGTLTANAWGIIGGGMHMLMHAFGKITLFFGAGAILVATHKTEISQMTGIGRKMPITMTTFFIGCVAIIGAPPTGAMWSKWALLVATANAQDMILLATVLFGSILSAAYFLPIAIRAFYPLQNESAEITEAPLPILIALVVSAFGCIFLFFFPNFAFDLMTKLVGASTLELLP